jgi:hypothetical protein
LVRYHADSTEVLYDLQNDPEEQFDLISEHRNVAARLSGALSDYLESMNVSYPTPDPLYDPVAEQQYLDQIENELIPRLEKQRLEYLAPDYSPGNNWWGSTPNEHPSQ